MAMAPTLVWTIFGRQGVAMAMDSSGLLLQRPHSGAKPWRRAAHSGKNAVFLRTRTTRTTRTTRSRRRDVRFCASSSPSAAEEECLATPTIHINDGAPIVIDTSMPAPPTDGSVSNSDSLESAASLVGNNMLEQARQIFMFAGPAIGIWLSGPIMSLIDTSVIGTSSSLELAALGPGTVLCDGLGYIFMFLYVATSNLVATALARKDTVEVADHLARLLFAALACGLGMLAVIELFCSSMLKGFVGQNTALIPAATTYVKIRSLSWPSVLIGMVAQSACLAMQDSWSPLKALAVASLVNAVGDIVLCTFLGYGIAGAAWATAASQYVTGILLLKCIRDKGYNPFRFDMPKASDLAYMFEIGAPILLTMLSKVCFYTTMTYLATCLGAITVAAHQVLIGVYTLFSVVGEPLSQTSQSFMPELLYGKHQSLEQAQMLLKTLLLISAAVGAGLATVSLSVPFLVPHWFTKDLAVIAEMREIAVPLFCGTLLIPPTLTLEGTLLAAREMRFLGVTMTACFAASGALLYISYKMRLGLAGSWWTMVFFQLSRFILSFIRVASSTSSLRVKQAS